jgi:ABC-type nitrate/sulfonate/bicarbonate transport system substrate-binding protein
MYIQKIKGTRNSSIIRFNVSASYNHVLSNIIKEKKLLSPYLPDGVTVEWSTINTTPELRDALVSGNVDITVLSSFAVITAIENNLPILILSGHVVNSCSIFSKNPNIKGIVDLMQANGIYVNSLTGSPALAALAMSWDEFNDTQILSKKFIAQSNELSLATFEFSDDIDCFAAGFPSAVRIMQMQGVHQVVDLTPYAQKYDLGNYYVANERFYKNNPQIIEAFRKALNDALSFVLNHPEEAAELLEYIFEIDKDITAEEIKKAPPSLEILGYDNVAGLLYEAGILSKPPMKFADVLNYVGLN